MDEMRERLFPVPQKITYGVGPASIEERILEWAKSYRIGREDDIPSGVECRFVASDEVHGEQGYRLRIELGRVVIECGGARALFYATQTLVQACAAFPSRLRGLSIEDWPDIPVRGVLLDVSRDRVPRMDTLFQLIDSFARWRYNELQLYIEHTFAYRDHREVWEHASPFTHEEITAVREYCAARGMELVPNQNSFGHMERWLRHESYKDLAESPDGFIDPWGRFREFSSTLAPVVERTRPFLARLYDEILPLYESSYLNVGGDEPWELGKGRSEVACRERGLDQVYLDFLLDLHAIAAERGKRVQVYGDIIMKHPHLIPRLPRDMLVVEWGYEATHPFDEECRRIAHAGLPFYICGGTSAWNSLAGRWKNARGNIDGAVGSARTHGAAGVYVSEWGDNGHWQQLWAGLPPLLYGGGALWNGDAAREFSFVESVSQEIFGGDEHLARAAYALQHVGECTPGVIHNASLPVLMLLDPTYPYYRDDYSRYAGYRFERELSLIEEARAELDRITDSPGNEMVLREMLFTARLLRHGCRLGQAQLATPSLSVAEIPPTTRSSLAEELRPLIDEYRALWRMRSREGGLADSSSRFETLLAVYEGTAELA